MKNKVFLLSQLLRRDLAARYAGSFAGPFWAILNPAIMCALNAFVFAYVLKVPTPKGFQGTFVEFLLAGMLPWLGIQEAIVRGTTSVTDQAHLVKKLKFPVALLTLSSVGAALVIQTISIALLTGFLLVAGRGSVDPLLLAAAFAFELLLLVGPALILASLNPFFRDLAQILPPVLMIAFYVTPILYPESLMPAWATPLLTFNPLRDVIALFRAALFGMPVPPWRRLGIETAAFIVLGFLGRQLYRRLRPAFADVL
ncbi:MAG: ABC transporter permease [Acidobacteria bacterium]|nr:ABC transporter permease [Acidobacteriota bacterium]